MRTLKHRIRRFLTHRRLPLVLAALALALTAPALTLGLLADDHFLQLVLMDPPPDPEWARTPVDLFAFLRGDEDLTRRAIAQGGLPWWTHEGLRLAFFRPVTGLTHWLDFRLWPGRPWAMHLQSLLWLAAAVAAAAVAYRRLLRPRWAAGLAALLFAVDDAHGVPAAWLANRNASIAALFALAALVAHDRWRRDGWHPGAAVAPVLLLVGLLAGELALAAGAYLLAYALFLDPGRWPRRLASLAPAAAVGALWWIAYRGLGYGVAGSGVYIDPGASPGEYVRAVAERAPLLLFGQWALPSNLAAMLSEGAAGVLWLVACGLLVALAGLFLPLVRRDRTARFFALGMVLSLLPVCATFPDDRLLFLVGFGGTGLVAQLLAALWERPDRLPRALSWRLPARALGGALVAIHLLLAPLSLLGTSARMKSFSDVIHRAAASLPADPAVRHQQVLIVNTPSAFVSLHGPLIQALEGRTIPGRTLILGSGIHPIEVVRRGDNVLVVRPEGGFLAPRGSSPPGREAEQPAFDPRYVFAMLDLLYRDASPMRPGERIPLAGVTVEITAVTEDGRPAEAAFRFATSLDDPSLRWLEWRDGVYAAFALPAVGEAVTLPAVTVPL